MSGDKPSVLTPRPHPPINANALVEPTTNDNRGMANRSDDDNDKHDLSGTFVLQSWYPYHVVAGHSTGSSSGRFMTRATAMFREIKVNYATSFLGLAEEVSYEQAVDEYCHLIRQEFPALADKGRDDIFATVVVVDEVIQGATTSSSSSSSLSIIITSGEASILEYFRSAEMLSIRQHVTYHRMEYEKTRRRGLVGSGFEDFNNCLVFCESSLEQVSNGLLSSESLEDFNIVATLGEQWRSTMLSEPVFATLVNEGKRAARASSNPSTTNLLPKKASSAAAKTERSSNAKASLMDQAFLVACERCDLRTAEKLFRQGASVYAVDVANGETALEKAVKGNHILLLEFLVDQGGRLGKRTTRGAPDHPHDNDDTLMHLAAWHGHVQVMHFLRDHQNNDNVGMVDTPSHDGERPLHHACQQGHKAAVEWIVHASSDLFATDHDGSTALHTAAEHGHVSIMELLVLYDFDTQARNAMKCTPLDFAVWSGQVNVSEWLQAFQHHKHLHYHRRDDR